MLSCAVFSPSYALNTPETTITIISVNNQNYYDIEIMQDGSDKILLPTKQIADILQIPLKINHSTKELTFDDIKLTKTDVYKNGAKINSRKNVYLQKGMMDDVRDEIFCDEKVLSQIFNTKITVNKSDLSVTIKDDKLISEAEEENENQPKEEEKTFKVYTDVLVPIKKKKVTLDTIEFDNSTMGDTASQIYQNSKTTNYMFNNNSRISLKGMAYDGDYRVDFTTNNYQQNLFNFGGLSFNYKNELDGMHYELGKVTGFKNDHYQIGTQLIGAQIYDYNPQKTAYRDISGTVDEKSLVNVYVNDEFHSTLSTYKGNYSLNELFLKGEPQKIVLEELKEDGSKKIILTKIYPKYKEENDGILEKENRKSLFAGISGFNDRLFAQDGYIYQMNTKKFVMGARQQYAIKENLISDSQMIYDRIVTKSENSIWAQNYYNNNSILSMGTYRNPNTLQGMTALNSINYYINDNFRLRSLLGVSQSEDIANEEGYSAGYTFALDSEYKKENLTFNLGVYNQSPDFYLAGAQYGFVSDRLGAKIGGNYRYKDWGCSGSYNKYYSNLEKKYDASITDFDEISFNLSGRVKNIAQVRYNFNGRRGTNNIGENVSYYNDLNIMKVFRNGISVEAGKQESSYSTDYFSVTESQNGFSSLFSTVYVKTRLPMPKNKGTLELGNDNISCVSNGHPNDYSMIKFNYIFPEMKRVLLSAGAGYKYTGIDKGLNYNMSIGYRLQSGMVMSLSYQYNTNGGYLIDNMYIPSNARHSINLSLNDAYAVMPSGLKSVGYADASKGFVEVVAYLDKNNNNIYDEGDIGVENVPVRLSWVNNEVYTDKNGKIPVATADKGVYKVSLDNEKLQSNLSSSKGSKESQLVLVNPKQQTTVAFKLISSVGNVKGNLKIIDDFGRNMPIKDFIVVLHDESDLEVAYSTVDPNGDYCFSGVQPGKYTLMLDESFLQTYNLQPFEGKGKQEIDIPFVYKDFVDINDKNIAYKCW